jgi:microcystin-dependent protein
MPNPPTAIFALPGPDMGDAANIETSLDPLRLRLEEVMAELAAGKQEIGELSFWCGSGDPPVDPSGIQRKVMADGRLVDRTVHATFFSRFGHTFNGGVDPGSNMVRIPDLRGRVAVGADNMGTAQGTANRLSAADTLGAAAGAQLHTLTLAETPSHNHPPSSAELGDFVHRAVGAFGSLVGGSGTTAFEHTSGTGFAGGGIAHNNMQPYQIVNYIVRVR